MPSTESIIKYKNLKPEIHESAFIAKGVIIAGDVKINEDCGIWFNSVLRGDVAPISVGARTNIQDGTVVHTSRFNNGKTEIGSDITIGHMALIHACTLKDNCFIGMKAVVMDGAIIEEYGFVAAGALITPGKKIAPYELWAGTPAKFIRKITEKELEFMKDNANHYVTLAKEYLK